MYKSKAPNKNKLKTIIFDFDHTLFDTEMIKPMMKTFYTERGVPEKVYDEVRTFQRKRDVNAGMTEQWEEMTKRGYKISKKELNDFFKTDLSLYLKGPVKEVLTKLKKRGYTLMILSMGIDDFQRFKIRQSGIESFFADHIYTCKEDKPRALKKISTTGEVYFVNDHANEIEVVLKSFPKIHPIYVKGPKTAHDHFLNHKKIPTISDISELLKILG